MNNSLLRIKVKERLNKLSSNDYDNLEDWQIIEAVNKEQLQWARRKIDGDKGQQNGAESSIRVIDDLQPLLVPGKVLSGRNVNYNGLNYFETEELPGNYLGYSRITGISDIPGCDGIERIKVYLAEAANLDELLGDVNSNPSLEWRETLAIIADNKIQVQGGKELYMKSTELSYYRFPASIQISGSVDPNTGNISERDVECEFRDDITEIIIDGACATLAGDLENFNQMQRQRQVAEISK